MSTLTVQALWSLGPLSHQFLIRDLDVLPVSGGHVLYGTNGSTGGVVSYQINAATGALTLGDTQLFPPLASVDGPAHLERLDIGAQSFVVNLGRHAAGLEALQIEPGAGLDTRIDLGGTAGAGISTLTFHAADTRDVVYAGYWGRSDIGIYQVTSGGALTFLGQVNSPFTTHGADLVDMRVTSVSGQDILVMASRYQDQIYSYTINSNGGLAVADVLRMTDGLPVDVPSAIEIAEIGGQRFAILASAGTSSLTVLELSATGDLTPTDHINANTWTRIANVSALDTVTVGDRAYVVAGGGNDGISLFELLPDGRLYHMDAQEDLVTTALANVTAVTAVQRGTGLDIYASSASEYGVTQLRVELGVQAANTIGTAGNDTLAGGNANDLIYGGDGDDNISGGDGNDVIMDGAGDDRLTGGAGADVFVLRGGGDSDHITDFELGVDRIDMSGFGRVYDVSALTWSERSAGAVITYGEQVLVINTSNATVLRASDFTAQDLFDLSHTDLSYMEGGIDPAGDLSAPGNFEGSAGQDTLVGTSRSDMMRGNIGNDTLFGGVGDDTLNGGEGADVLDGGDGNDFVSYAGSRGSLRVDLMFSQLNTNVAAGDTFQGIENLIGSQGFDNLRGTLGDNVIRGEANVDYIFGRRGNDTLEGGVGDDVLFGGVGADVLIGGANRDRAQYSEAITAVRVDLQFTGNNTGEAVGDTYDSIEDVAGGRFDDMLYGDAGVNRLFGREGNDLLMGRDGNDYLNGGANSDTLDGGAGNDVLRGGQSMDTFVFREGIDIIEDFNETWDMIQLNQFLLGGGAITGERALEFASVVGGDLVFSFDTGDQLTLQSVTDTSTIADNIIFV